MSDSSHRSSFFRQIGRLLIDTVGGGAFMWAVQLLNTIIAQRLRGVRSFPRGHNVRSHHAGSDDPCAANRQGRRAESRT